MTRIILIRHGESVANKDNIFAGHLNADLTELGLSQAKLTAEYIANNYKVDKVYASDLNRAFFTGKATADRLGLGIEKSQGLREIDAGKWDGVVFTDLPKIFPEEFDLWIKDVGNAHCPNGESVFELSQRIMAELNRIADENEGKTVAVASHATPIRCAITLIKHKSLDKMKEVGWVTNASVTVIEKENGKWSLISVSEDSHLAELSTALPDNV